MLEFNLDFTGYEIYSAFEGKEINSYNWESYFSSGIGRLIMTENIAHILDDHIKNNVLEAASNLVHKAFKQENETSLFEAHRTLFYLLNQQVESPGRVSSLNQNNLLLLEIREKIKKSWEEYEISKIPNLLEYDKLSASDFVLQIKNIWQNHNAFSHGIFDYMKNDATANDIKLYITSDYVMNVRFYDLIVLSMVAIPEQTRIEVAKNLWDEMGCGKSNLTHIQLFRNVLKYISPSFDIQSAIGLLGWKGLAGYNLLLNQVLCRNNYFRSIGAMAITELADPNQYEKFIIGCNRTGLSGEWLAYYSEHIAIDSIHGDGWIENVIAPIVKEYPRFRNEILEGVYMRLNTSCSYWDEVFEKMDK